MKEEQDQLIDTNQTEFSSVEPLFEKPPVDPSSLTKKPMSRTQKIMMIVIGVVVAVILLVIVLAVMLSQQQITQEPDPEPTLAPTVELDPLRQEINQLRAELEAADPTTQELPFPPVNLNIYLDQQR